MLMATRFAMLALAAPLMLLAAGNPPKADSKAASPYLETSETQHVEFPAGGELNLKHLSGELTVEGWDRADVEITTVKYTRLEYKGADRDQASKLLQAVHVTAARHDNQVVVETSAPPQRHFLTLVFGLKWAVDYRIKVPRNARLVVEHRSGEVHIMDVAGDIKASVRQGLITLMLPADGRYTIDANCKLGDVVSDFDGQKHDKSWRFSHSFTNAASGTSHKLDLRIQFGDIIIRQETETAHASN
jgi:hypothetical protein